MAAMSEVLLQPLASSTWHKGGGTPQGERRQQSSQCSTSSTVPASPQMKQNCSSFSVPLSAASSRSCRGAERREGSRAGAAVSTQYSAGRQAVTTPQQWRRASSRCSLPTQLSPPAASCARSSPHPSAAQQAQQEGHRPGHSIHS